MAQMDDPYFNQDSAPNAAIIIDGSRVEMEVQFTTNETGELEISNLPRLMEFVEASDDLLSLEEYMAELERVEKEHPNMQKLTSLKAKLSLRIEELKGFDASRPAVFETMPITVGAPVTQVAVQEPPLIKRKDFLQYLAERYDGFKLTNSQIQAMIDFASATLPALETGVAPEDLENVLAMYFEFLSQERATTALYTNPIEEDNLSSPDLIEEKNGPIAEDFTNVSANYWSTQDPEGVALAATEGELLDQYNRITGKLTQENSKALNEEKPMALTLKPKVANTDGAINTIAIIEITILLGILISVLALAGR